MRDLGTPQNYSKPEPTTTVLKVNPSANIVQM